LVLRFEMYHLSIGFLISFLVDALVGNRRSFHQDGIHIASKMGVPMEIHGDKFIPQAGPGLVVFNHYSREGFPILNAAAALAASIPIEMHWVMTGAWTFPGRLFRIQLRSISEWVLSRIASVYGFTLTPPIPPDPADQPVRTAAIRKVFQYIKGNPKALVALAPEGRDFPGGVLGEPPAGSGKFLSELSRRLGPIYPVGIYEEDDALHLNFGAPFELCSIINLSSKNPEEASVVVMEHLAALLPQHLVGQFSQDQETHIAANPNELLQQ
jgi:1-acyl-sn-glycerol-3-phosphate acyltransferase